MKECEKCGFLNDYGACDCPHSDKWYACPIEDKKSENIKALEDYAKWAETARLWRSMQNGQKGAVRNDS